MKCFRSDYLQFCSATVKFSFCVASGRGVSTGRAREGYAPHFNFRIKKGPKVSVLNIRGIAFYRHSEIIRTRNFTIFTVYAIIFSNYIGEIYHFTFWKAPILNAGPSEEFLFVCHPKEDHNEREFKPQIIAGILNLPKKSSKTREASIISGSQLNIITSILELLKILSEVIAVSKCGPLARTEKQAML